MAELLAAYPDPRLTISHASGRRDRPRRAHVIRDDAKQCGKTQLDLVNALDSLGNDTVDLARSLTTPARKRGGARYGPAPEKTPHEGMQAPKRMDKGRRRSRGDGIAAVYARYCGEDVAP